MWFGRTLKGFVFYTAILFLGGQAFAAEPPNILVIWGDDIGGFNIN
jgi:hypothetical protein